MSTWYLEDASAKATASPYTFYKPPAEVIRKIQTGEIVRLIFCFESDDPEAPRAERMWVVVETMDGKGGFVGKLDNQPGYIKDLQKGDAITFRDVHIVNTLHDGRENLIEKYIAR